MSISFCSLFPTFLAYLHGFRKVVIFVLLLKVTFQYHSNAGSGRIKYFRSFERLGMLFGWHIIAASIAINIATSVPTIDYPLNSQVPQVVRVSKPFSYTFPKSTFSSNLPIIYQLSGPKWLSLDNENRTLSGTPSEQDVGKDTLTNVAISLTASDSSGPNTLNATLVVSKNPAPTINVPLSSQLPFFGTFSIPSTLSYHPTTPFKFSFDPDTFSSDVTGKLNYYAVTADHTPMPSWVKFDGSTLTFSGQTPDYASLIQPPQTFGITLIASDVEGYAGSSINFDITVGPHQLFFSNTTMSFNATGGNTVNFTGLANNLQLDGQNVNSTTITKFTVDTPSWLAFDNSTMTISGKALPDVVPKNLTVHAEDIYGDSANATILLQVEDSIFSKEIPNLNATVGSDFKYDLSSYLRNPSDADVAFKTKPSQSWIKLDSSKIVLSGNVPEIVKPGDIEISIKAASKTSGASETQTFKFAVAAQIKPSATSTKSTEATSTTKPTQTASGTPLEASARKLSRGAILAIAITISAVVLFLVLLALFLFCRKRRRDAKKRPASITKSDISAPIESHSSVEEIVLPPPVAAPPPLELDTSTFLDTSPTHGLTTNEKHESWRYIPRKSSPPQDRRVRRSQTISGDGLERRSQLMSGGIGAPDITPGEAKTTGNRVRSYSENALSKTDSSWRSTQESASHPTLRSSRTNSSQLLGVARTYSNYSRKGHKHRSARVLDTIVIGDPEESNPNVTVLANSSPPPSQPSQPLQYLDTANRESSILGLTGSDISATPLDNFSALGRKKSVSPQPPDIVYIPEGVNNSRVTSRTSRRQTRMFPGFENRRRSGNGHGVNRSISSLSSKSTKRRSIGHGQVWTTNTNLNHNLGQKPSLARNSRTWKTVATSSNQTERPPSGISALSEYSDTYPTSPPIRSAMHMGIRQVTMSPEIQDSTFRRPSNSSSRNSRPVSRRIGSSPFFGGGSMRSSNRDSRLARTRTSYADSPTVPEEPLIFSSFENTLHQPHPLREEEPIPRDSFGISYGMARESTRQLRSYIQDQGFGTRGSVRSLESRDSRFESANESLRSPTKSQISSPVRQEREDSYEDFLPEDYSDGSWETQPDSRNDPANVTILGGTESELGEEQKPEDSESDLTARMGSARANLIPGPGAGESSRTAEKSKSYAPEGGRGRDVGGGPGPRIFKGARRRPISVDAAHSGLKGSVRGRIEGDDTGGGGEGEWGAFI